MLLVPATKASDAVVQNSPSPLIDPAGTLIHGRYGRTARTFFTSSSLNGSVRSAVRVAISIVEASRKKPEPLLAKPTIRLSFMASTVSAVPIRCQSDKRIVGFAKSGSGFLDRKHT